MNLASGKSLGGFLKAITPLGIEPPVAARFLFEVEGVEVGVFKEVTGLAFDVEVFPIIEGGQNNYVHQLPGRIKWTNITFKRGVMQSDALFEWASRTSGQGFHGNANKLERQWAAITAINSFGVPLRDWTLFEAFPVRWKGPDFGISNATALEEELVIAHHGFTSKTFLIP